jgi:hypothetical protein
MARPQVILSGTLLCCWCASEKRAISPDTPKKHCNGARPAADRSQVISSQLANVVLSGLT